MLDLLPTVQHRRIFYLAVVLLLAASAYGAQRLVFLSGAQRTHAEVTNLAVSSIRSCGGRSNRNPGQRCVSYRATVRFVVDAQPYAFDVSAGTARTRVRKPGEPRGRPLLTGAAYRAGDTVPVIYDPNRPARAYRDTTRDVWLRPFSLLIVSALVLAMSFVPLSVIGWLGRLRRG